MKARYEIQSLIGKDHSTITLSAIDRQEEANVTIRALQPNKTSIEERDIFLQDAELAFALSGHINETGSIRVIEYGQDGPITFLVKSETLIPVASKAESLAPLNNDTHSNLTYQGKTLSEKDDCIDSVDDVTEPREIISKESPDLSDKLPSEEPLEEISDQHKLFIATDVQPEELKTELNWLAEGDQAYQNTQYEEALSAYEKALSNDPFSVDAWSGKGATLLHLGYFEEALPGL